MTRYGPQFGPDITFLGVPPVDVADQLAAMPEVDYVVVTAGSFDILAEVVCENDEDLIELLNKQIRGIEGVQSTETFVYLKLVKQFYNWGTR